MQEAHKKRHRQEFAYFAKEVEVAGNQPAILLIDELNELEGMTDPKKCRNAGSTASNTSYFHVMWSANYFNCLDSCSRQANVRYFFANCHS